MAITIEIDQIIATENARILGELDNLLGTGCHAAIPEAVEDALRDADSARHLADRLSNEKAELLTKLGEAARLLGDLVTLAEESDGVIYGIDDFVTWGHIDVINFTRQFLATLTTSDSSHSSDQSDTKETPNA